ncbi:hypothetical protein D3H35_12880 [Cohnella faecalis]|uniref:Uncharacterized protein n=2 Tax=Cohnella faecalis TaxID=2315694 RepID=A0A398CI58_9BACL|nr:hypothetical protein D3H35_12880 [Cohnella faecalis]
MIIIFLGSVLISLILGFITNGRLFNDQLRVFVHDNLVSKGKTIIQAYEQSNPDNQDTLMKGLTALENYSIRMFDMEGNPLHETDPPPNPSLEVSSEQLRDVLNGGVYWSNSARGPSKWYSDFPLKLTGSPLLCS